MISRLTSATLVCFALLAGFGAANAAAVADGTYKGKEAGELEVKIKVKNNRITSFKSSVYASCYIDNFIISFAYPPVGKKGATIKIKNGGSFKTVFKSDPRVSFNDDKRTLKGKFNGNKVTGSMKVEGLCSAETTFTARK